MQSIKVVDHSGFHPDSKEALKLQKIWDSIRVPTKAPEKLMHKARRVK